MQHPAAAARQVATTDELLDWQDPDDLTICALVWLLGTGLANISGRKGKNRCVATESAGAASNIVPQWLTLLCRPSGLTPRLPAHSAPGSCILRRSDGANIIVYVTVW
jgi:hypothetical protein